MKFLIMGDFHEKEKSPICRKDDWQDTLDAKAKEIQEIALKEKVSAIIECGDFLDGPRMGEQYIGKIINRWDMVHRASQLFESNLKEKAIPMYGPIGNHELFGASLKNFDSTSLSLLKDIGFIKILGDEPFYFEMGDKKIALTGTAYFADIDKAPYSGYIVDEKKGDIHIHVVHGYATDKDLGPIIPHVTIDKFATQTKADITINGHDHIGYDLQQINGKYFLNPGAVTRLTASQKEMDRDVHVYILEIKDLKSGIKINFKKVSLQSAKKSDEVIDRSHIIDANQREENSKRIKEIIEVNKNNGVKTITDIVDDIANNSKLSKTVRDDLLERFNEKLKEEQVQNIKQVPKYTIKKLILENFQSHKYSEFDFDDKLNVLVGSSGSGKTSVMRAFSWIFENKIKDSRKLIHFNEDFASAKIILSSDISIERRVSSKKSGFNGYIVTYPDGTVEKLNTKGTERIQELLGFNYLKIDNSADGKEIPLNFLKQGDGWFFIGDETTSPDRAKIIGSVYKTHIADAIHKELELSIRENENIQKATEKKIIDIQNEIDCLPNIEDIKEVLDKSNLLICKLQKLISRKEILDKNVDIINESKKEIVRLTMIAKEIPDNLLLIKKINDGLTLIKEKTNKINFIEGQARKINESHSTIKNMMKVVSDISVNENYQIKINEGKDLINKYLRLIALYQKAQESKKLIFTFNSFVPDINTDEILNKIEQIRKNLNFIVAMDNAYKNAYILKKYIKLNEKLSLNIDITNIKTIINEKIQKYNDFKKMSIKLQSSIDDYKKKVTEYKLIEADLDKNKKDYADMLNKLGYCPVCHQKINDDTLKHIMEI